VSFSQPSAGGDQFDAKNHNGQLLIVFPKSFSAETPTAHGISASADVDIVVVDAIDPATGRPKYYQNARLFGNLAKSVSRDLGGQVLGRLGQVPTQRGNPAWVLQNYTDQDVALATPALQQYQQGLFKQAESPAQQQAPATPPQQWNAPSAAPGAAPQQQYQQAPAQTAYAPPQQGTPQYGQQQPPAAPAPAQYAAPAAAPAPAVDPADAARLAQFGITLPPGATPDMVQAILATLPQ
jgi:hypothetical protein